MSVLITGLLFFLWTLIIYILHRLAHIKHKFNFLYWVHISHHKVNYFKPENRKFKWHYLFFYFGGILETLDVLLILTLPALLIYLIDPKHGLYILFIHYFYEVFLSEGLLDHNPRVEGKITNFFSWGKYHLAHHKSWKYNFSLMITLWDYVFKTVKKQS
jgi:sterol desaturase/sphingolipid hydroxylase (fatty acid hydroxylase superfamily)